MDSQRFYIICLDLLGILDIIGITVFFKFVVIIFNSNDALSQDMLLYTPCDHITTLSLISVINYYYISYTVI